MPITKNPDDEFKPGQQPPRVSQPPGSQSDRDRERHEREQRDRDKRTQKPQPAPKAGAKEGEPPPEGADEPVQYTPNIPPETPEEERWQLYAVQATNGLYPRLRDGVDFAIGRRTYDGPIELLEQGEGVDIDWGKVQEHAQKLADADPYADYEPGPSLASTTRVEDPGEVPRRRHDSDERPTLPPNVGQSEVNPHLKEGEKHPTQPYVEGQRLDQGHPSDRR
jgi:hypothetical protein